MLSRSTNGKLRLKDFTLSVILDDLFEICENEEEVKFLFNNLKYVADKSATRRLEELDNDPGEIIFKEVSEDKTETLDFKGFCKDCKHLVKSYRKGHHCPNGNGTSNIIENIDTEFCSGFEIKI